MSREATLKLAEIALDKGAYKECLSALESLLEGTTLLKSNDGYIGTLMVTALIGQGKNQQAISICETLLKHKNDGIRQQAKQFLSILKSPELERPEDWSIKIPSLSIEDPLSSFKVLKKKNSEEIPKHIPTGQTRSFKSGFTLSSLLVIILLTILLSGCVQFTTKVELTGADRIKMGWDIKSNSKKKLPWQEEFEASIERIEPKVALQTHHDGQQIIESRSISSKDANILLNETISVAAGIAGIEIPTANIELVEKNWIVGIKQTLNLHVDLTSLPEIPKLKLAVSIAPPSKIQGVPNSYPKKTTLIKNQFNWELQEGTVNTLSLQKWHWSKLGIGSVVVFILMTLSMILQRIKLQMGFGFPELPP